MSKQQRKVLIVINDYLPIKGADGYCLHNILEILKKRYEIHVVTAGEKRESINNNDVYVYGVSNGAYIDQEIRKHILNKFINKRLKAILDGLTRIFFKIVKYVYWPDVSVIFRKRIEKECELLIKQHKFIAILTVSGSYTTQIVGLNIKRHNPYIPWIALLYDPLPIDSFIYELGVNTLRKRKLSYNIIKKTDVIITTKPLMERYLSNRYPYGKMHECGLPLIKIMDRIPVDKYINDNKVYNLLYIGSLNPKIRNPKYWFKLVAASNLKDSICIHIIGDLSSIKIAQELGIKEQCKFYGMLDKHEISNFYSQDAILINLGNYLTFQLPSKVLEYISTGLPIISIEPNTENSTIQILQNYTNAIVIDENNDFYKNSELFDAFLINPYQRISFDTIEEIFYKHTPHWNADLLISIIDKENEC